MNAEELVRTYYTAFNAGNFEKMVSLLTEDVAHDVNQGERQVGRAAFTAFLAHMDQCYSEQLENIVVMTTPDGTRAAAEFMVHGIYRGTDEGLPPAHGQRYVLPAGAFFDISPGGIARVTNFYNLRDWLRQIQ
jgi:steroid delta-isomerase-like uncharacterized protein